MADNVNKAAFAWLGWQGINAVSQMFQLGQTVNQTAATFAALTSNIGGSASNMQALRQSTGGIVDDMTLMEGSAKMLQMGIAGNTDELSGMMGMAVKLGASMGMDVNKSLSDFSLMLANNSIMRLDQFGISSGQVRQRIIELQAATDGLSRSDAFKMAVMEIGSTALNRLGSAATAAETPMNRLAASLSNMAQQFSSDFATGLNSTISLLELAAGKNPVQQQIDNSATANATAYAQRYHEALGSEFSQLGTADLLLKAGFTEAAKNPNASITELTQNAFASMNYNDMVGLTDEDQQRMYSATYTMLEQQRTAEATVAAQQANAEALAESARQAALLKSYQELPEDRTLALSQQREALAYAKERNDATIEYGNAIAQVGYQLMSISGEQDPMSQMYTGKLDASQVAGMLPEFMKPEAADAITQQFKDAQTELFRLHELADKKLISDDQLTQAENLTSNLGLMADQAQKASDAFKNLTLSQALGQESGGIKGELTDQLLGYMKDKGYGKSTINKMQEELNLDNGRETSASEELKAKIIPMLAKMTAKQAAQAISNIDALLKEGTLQGLSEDQIAAMLPDVVGYEAEGHTRDKTQAEIDAALKRWQDDHKKQKVRNKDGTYSYTGNYLDELGNIASYTPDPNQKVNYTTFSGGFDFSSQMSNYIMSQMGGGGMYSGSKAFGDISGMNEGFGDGKSKDKGGLGGMSKDMTVIAKDSETVSDNLASIARSTTAAARVADVFQKSINEIPNTKKIVFDFTANDPQGLVKLVRDLLGGNLSLAGVVRDNGGQLPGTGHHVNGGGV